MKKINIKTIRTDGETQARAEINLATVAEYADAIKAGVEFPAVVVFHDGADNWLADGFHRFHAHNEAGKASISAEVKQGTQRDAILYSLGANATHGLRRSNADKRKAVATMLADAEWASWSDRKIAELCGVSVSFVGATRNPEVAEKQKANRQSSVEKTVEKCSPTTPSSAKRPEQVESDSTPAVETASKHTAKFVEPAPENEELKEAAHTINQLAVENEQLRDRLAVEQMDVSEEGKSEAAQIIEELRHQVKTLEAELDATKSSRDGYQRNNSELMKQVRMLTSQLKKQEA